MIAIGLGSGRSGTKSLAGLVSLQKHSVCFHEMIASNVMFEGTEWPIVNSLRDFTDILAGGDRRHLCVDLADDSVARTYGKLINMGEVATIGDVASYYLRYVP